MRASAIVCDEVDSPATGQGRTRVLVIDDEEEMRTVVSRMLAAQGHSVAVASDGEAALDEIRAGDIDAVVSDIHMPGMDGVVLLRTIRDEGLGIPVIFLTGSPSLETARAAVEFGAFRYLVKPIRPAELAKTVARAVSSRRLTDLKREAQGITGGGSTEPPESSPLQVRFERALEGLWIAYQPIVRTRDATVFGYEALLRSEEPSLGSPSAILDAAERLDRLQELGRTIRDRAVAPLSGISSEVALFLNLHPAELFDEELLSPQSAVSRWASRIFLEITERTAISSHVRTRDRISALRCSGYRIAVDDLGAGYAGLTSFATLEPEVIKLDMALTQGVASSLLKRRLIRAMCDVCREMEIRVVAEGIETQSDFDTVTSLGCDFAQGFFLGGPARWLPEVPLV